MQLCCTEVEQRNGYIMASDNGQADPVAVLLAIARCTVVDDTGEAGRTLWLACWGRGCCRGCSCGSGGGRWISHTSEVRGDPVAAKPEALLVVGLLACTVAAIVMHKGGAPMASWDALTRSCRGCSGCGSCSCWWWCHTPDDRDIDTDIEDGRAHIEGLCLTGAAGGTVVANTRNAEPARRNL